MMSDTEEDAGDHGIESEAEDENESNSQQEHESGFGTFCGALNEFGQDLARGFQTFAKSTADGVEGLAKGEFCQNTARGIDELGKNAASGFHDFVRNTANGFKDFAASEFCENTARASTNSGRTLPTHSTVSGRTLQMDLANSAKWQRAPRRQLWNGSRSIRRR